MKILIIFIVFAHTLLSQSIPLGKKITIWKLDNKNSLRSYETSLLSTILIKNNIPFQYKTVSSSRELFKEIEKANKKNDPYHIAISNISVTKQKEQLFSFSAPYIKSAYVFIGKYITNSSDLNIAYLNTAENKIKMKKVLEKNKLTYSSFPYESLKEGINNLKSKDADNNKIHYIFSGYLDSFVNKNLKVAKVFKENDEQIAMMYPKNSILKDVIDPLLENYLNSDMDKKYIKKYLGRDAIDFITTSRK